MTRARYAVLPLVLVASLTACNSKDEKTVTETANAAAKSGGVLRVGITTPAGIDPLSAYEPAGKLVSSAMCDTIVAIDPATGQMRNALAERWVIPNGQDITVKLKKGVKFNDGTELKSKDVNFSLQQLVSPATGSYAAALGKAIYPLGGIDLSKDVLDDQSKAPDVINVINTHDFQAAPPRSNGGTLRVMAEPANAPFARAAFERDTTKFKASPVCVGPYQLDKPYASGDKSIVLKRSKSYYAGNDGYTLGGAGYADTIQFTIYADANAALEGYRRNEVDVVQVPSTSVNRVSDAASIVYGPPTGVEYIGLPLGTDNEFLSSEVRIALSQAIDRAALVKNVFGASSIAANGFLPPALAVTEGPGLKNKKTKGSDLGSCGDSTPATANAAAAKARLAAATKGKGLKSLTLEVNNDGPYVAMAAALAQQWKANLGIDVKVVSETWNDYVAKAGQGAGFESPFRVRWATDANGPAGAFNDPQAFLSVLFNNDVNGNAAWGHWDDKDFSFKLNDDAAGIADVQRRAIAFREVGETLCAQMPLIPLVFDRPTFLIRKDKVAGARDTLIGRDGLVLLRDLYLK